MVTVELAKGNGILLRSPFKLEVTDGDAKVWYFDVNTLSVEMEGVDVIVWSQEGSKLEVVGEIKRLENPIPDWWDRIVEEIEGKRTMFIGRVDSGKSSTIMYVASRLITEGKSVSVIDSDIGQSDLGPPGVISAKTIDKEFTHLKLLNPDLMYFVGDTTPRGHLLPMVVGVKSLSGNAGSDTQLLNTTGYVDGSPARALKKFKAEVYDPDVVVLIEKEEGDLKHIERSLPPWIKVLKVRSPKEVSVKSKNYRRVVRMEMMESFLKGSIRVQVDLKNIPLMNTALLTGDPKLEYSGLLNELLNVEVVWVEESPDSLIALYRGEIDQYRVNTLSRLLNKEVKLGNVNDYSNLYVGLIKGRTCVGVGILKELDLRSYRASLIASTEQFDALALGYVRFDDTGGEIGKRPLTAP